MRRKPVKQQQSREVVRVALGALESNSHWNLVGRILLMVFALGTATAATVLVVFRADETVGVLTDSSRNDEIGKQLLALSAPVLLLLALAGLAVLVGFLVHSRGLDESVKTLDSVNRLRREDEVAVSARGLIVAFEDQLASIKRSHGVILWVARIAVHRHHRPVPGLRWGPRSRTASTRRPRCWAPPRWPARCSARRPACRPRSRTRPPTCCRCS